MSPIAKEPEIQNSAAPASTVSATQPKVQPVALEIAVTVNGARAVEGSDKREPFSETTQTVLVFSNGAVIRLNSTVASGQLLFLTNEKTKKEVVCQVVKSKNYRSVSGYVELEFTEPAVGFWGMRFPGDRAVASVPNAAASVKPMPVAISGEAKTVLPVQEAKSVAPPAPIVAAAGVVVPSVTPVNAAPAPNASDELKKETARLQEQLSSMLFAEGGSKKAESVNSSSDKPAISEASAKVIEFAKAEPVQAAKPFEPLNLTPAAQKHKSSGTMQDEEVKIPSWLEPLARNAASQPAAVVPPPVVSSAPVQVVPLTAEPAEKPAETETPVAAEVHSFGNSSEVTPETSEANEVAVPNFSSDLFQSTDESTSEPASGGKKGLWIGLIAATLILAAGGWWWYTQQSGTVSAKAAPALQPQLVEPATTNPEPQQKYLASTSIPAAGKTFSTPSPVSTQADTSQKASVTPAMEVQKIPNTANAGKPAAVPTSVATRAADPVEEPHKSAFSQLRLAAPKVKGGSTSVVSSEADPGIALENSATNSAGGVATGLTASHGSQPAAPISVGGEVKPVQLISSVPPVYPQLARSQRVSGDVKIDALIGENGRVTSMKVVGGPVLLHQSAMDSLRQWKYRPATLDGKAVSMHLVVTVQFRLQ
jgi:TonB family protein